MTDIDFGVFWQRAKEQYEEERKRWSPDALPRMSHAGSEPYEYQTSEDREAERLIADMLREDPDAVLIPATELWSRGLIRAETMEYPARRYLLY